MRYRGEFPIDGAASKSSLFISKLKKGPANFNRFLAKKVWFFDTNQVLSIFFSKLNI